MFAKALVEIENAVIFQRFAFSAFRVSFDHPCLVRLHRVQLFVQQRQIADCMNQFIAVKCFLGFRGVARQAETWLRDPAHSDGALQAVLQEGQGETDEVFSAILTTAVYRAFAFFEFALLTGDAAMNEEAQKTLRGALRVADHVGAVPLWWIIRVALNLIDDLWANSLHQVLPEVGPDGAGGYAELREMFLASLYARKTAEVELWPSQIGAARRAIDLTDDLVVALPTSAGKTRVAEICSLMSLSAEKRVLLVTPLTFDLDDDGPFIQDFVKQQPPINPRRTPFPKDNFELTMAAAWTFSGEGKRTLVFCTQRDHVESYARKIVDLARRGFLVPLLDDGDAIERARSVGAEWLGAEHPAVQCLALGVAIHHARLPNPFLREVERLLSEGVLTVTVASPTLAQGLNLNAAVLLVPNLYRAGAPLTGEEFANVAGRAGRAFVDLEGLVIHVMYEPLRWRRLAWRNLVNASRARTLESGLIQIASEILNRLARGGALNRADAFEYLANNRDAWDIHVDEEDDEPFELLLEKLDNAIFGLVDALDADDEDLPRLIDEALNGSLWARQLARRADDLRERQLNLFKARSGLIWSETTANQRRGHFAMGVGLEAGLRLDEMADELAALLDQADEAALGGDAEMLLAALTNLAARLLAIRPFVPDDPLPPNWRDVLAAWLSGMPVRNIGPDNMRFIEDVFTYRLVWALEALRTRRVALEWQPEIIAGTAAACLETGLPRYMMALLVRAGLPSREAAIAAINDQEPVVLDTEDLIAWLESNHIAALTDAGNWPTPETASIWAQFRAEMLNRTSQRWTSREWRRNIDMDSRQIDPVPGRAYRIEIAEDGTVWVLTPDFERVVMLRRTMIDLAPSVLTARFEEGSSQAIIRRLGRSRATWSER